MIGADSSWGSAGDGLCHGVIVNIDLLMPAWSQANNITGVTVLWAVVGRPLPFFWLVLDRDSLPGARYACLEVSAMLIARRYHVVQLTA